MISLIYKHVFLLLLQMGKIGTASNKNRTSQNNKNEQKVKASNGSKRKKAVRRNTQASISFFKTVKVKVM